MPIHPRIIEVFAASGRADQHDLMKKVNKEFRPPVGKGYSHMYKTALDAELAMTLRGMGFILQGERVEEFEILDIPIILPSKVDHALCERVRTIEEEGERLVSEGKKLLYQVHDLRVKAVASLFPDVVPHHLSVDKGWTCDGSPTGYCAYDTWSDGAMDQCLFCGEPDERK